MAYNSQILFECCFPDAGQTESIAIKQPLTLFTGFANFAQASQRIVFVCERKALGLRYFLNQFDFALAASTATPWQLVRSSAAPRSTKAVRSWCHNHRRNSHIDMVDRAVTDYWDSALV